jgi:protein ImuA
MEKRGDTGTAAHSARRLPAGPSLSTLHSPPSTADWDTWLPGARTVVEWLADGPGCGAQTLALALLARSLPDDGTIVIVDPQREFYPPAAAALGIDLAHTIVVRPADEAAALWALEQTLRSRGVDAAFCRLGAINDRASRRLQLAVEHGGGRGVLVRPAYFRRQPSWADARLLVRPVCPYGARPAGTRLNECHPSSLIPHLSSLHARRLQIEILSLRGGAPGGVCEVELCHETGGVRLVPQLARAAPATSTRAAGA